MRFGSMFVYNLVTKKNYFNKPNYVTLNMCLEDLRAHALDNSVLAVSIPRLGCGLDKLDWTIVRKLLCKTFTNTNIKITVYHL